MQCALRARRLVSFGDVRNTAGNGVSHSHWQCVPSRIFRPRLYLFSALFADEGLASKLISPGKGTDHVIQVGLNGLTYTPSNISAAVGDTVTFEFHQKNHTVTQSSFDDPCHARTFNGVADGFKSGFRFVPPNQTADFPTFQITINNTQPIWGYCGQQGPPPHCEQGMVFSINADEAGPNNFAAFLAKAKSGASSASINTQTASAAPSASGSAAGKFLAADLASNSGGTSSEPSPTLIALIVIIGVLVVGIIVIAVMYFRKGRGAARGAPHKPLYMGLGTAEPVFVAREKSDEKSDEEEESHGLTHGPYYDPHEST
ncbi:Cupredoxin [Mycena pura]|uniref:Cupredoxin n=1 Tax=Mycena pura TaxID=153505 RepID=A0AAD6VMC1_9AGAR|nr:Cupredoxin [Mycena pura]